MINIPEIQRTSRVIRAGRKLRGLTQVELAKKIAVAQSTISKYESGILLPDVSFWFSFCKLVGIEAQSSFESGRIEKQLEPIGVEPKTPSFRIPENYLPKNLSISVRLLGPILMAAKQVLGEEEVKKYLLSKKIDADLFFVQQEQLSLNFVTDLLTSLLAKTDQTELLNIAVRYYSGTLADQIGQSTSEVVQHFSSLNNLFTFQISPLQGEYQQVLLQTVPAFTTSTKEEIVSWVQEYEHACLAEYLNHNKKTKVERNKAGFQITVIQ